MANTTLTDSSNVEQWADSFAAEYIRESGFQKYMGTAEGSIIRVRNELVNSVGTIVHVPHIARLRGAGVTGSTTLKGSEEALVNYSFAVRTLMKRQGVTILKSDAIKTKMDLLNAAKGALKDWASNALRDDIIASLQSVNIVGAANSDSTPGEDTAKTYTAASAAERNAWLVANTDRVLYGAIKANHVSGVALTALDTIDATNDKMTSAQVSLAKRIAKQSGSASGKNRIMPHKTSEGREFYVLFCDSNGFRDLKADATIVAANREARPRDIESNPLFMDGDLLFDGVLIREIPEIPAFATNTGSVVVGSAFLCGQGALTLAYSQKPTPKTDIDDYDFKSGVAIEEVRSQTGMLTSFNGVMYGCVRVFHASTVDG